MQYIKELKKLASSISILYVEDDNDTRKAVVKYLKMIFKEVKEAPDGVIGLQEYKKQHFDIVITDILMPNKDGLEMAKEIKAINPMQEILFMTAFSDSSYLLEAISLNAGGYIIKPINYDTLNELLFKVAQKIDVFRKQKEYEEHLQEMVKQETKKNLKLEKTQIDNYEQTLLSLVELVEKRDTYTGGHSLRVAKYCQLIAKKMGYSKKECDLLYEAGILHDIGKIETPDAVLLKPGKLDALEYKLIQQHVVTGEELLSKISMYKELAKIIGSHHERYDGKGYPRGLKGDEIPELSRIMILADAFDAMTTNRIYKPRMSLQKALEQMQNLSGTQFDPKVAKYALEVLKDIKIDPNIAQLPSSEMEKKRFAFFFTDQDLDIYNSKYLDLVLIQNQQSKQFDYAKIIVIHDFAQMKSILGWEKANAFLKDIASFLKKRYVGDFIFVLNNEHFIVLSKDDIKIDIAIFNELLTKYDNAVYLESIILDIKKDGINSLSILESILNR